MKKTLFRVLTLALVSVMLVCMLASCGNAYGKIEKNFKDAGYTVKSVEDNDTGKTLTAAFEEMEISATVHVFTKDVNVAIVVEFEAEGDLDKAMENETLKGLIKDVQKSDIVRDECLLIPVTLNIVDIKGQINAMIEIFNK